MASLETDASGLNTTRAASSRLGLFFAGVATITATALLWWRFGEGVYATSIMNAILVCF